ncbi:hypothetical protein [Streptomyces sp. NPDC088736]|uniref:hypothetical protein n=1 Tax=Streptomyces sp. NPDC088736 TaxID=3365881 RepID=UPI003823CB80
MADLHVTPVGDAIEHDTSADSACVCGPTDKPVPREDGSIGWIAVHHSLDGRERPRGETTLTILLDERDFGGEA